MPVRKHDPKQLREAGLTEKELHAITEDFSQKSTDYEQTSQYVTNILLKTPGVHSVRYRVKDPTHLAEKILRKKLLDKERILTLETYEQEITDLAGIRILHLFKNDWQRIHEFIMNTWELKEKPTAYYRKGDPEDFLQMFEGCDVKPHDYGYRSVHYIIETSPTKAKRYVELQVRTIFEEGWSEIDHKIRYPNFSDNPLTNNLLMILNRLAGSADEMSNFVQQLSNHLTESQDNYIKLDRKRAELQRIIDKKSTSKEDKWVLQGFADMLSTATDVELPDLTKGSGSIFLNHLLFTKSFLRGKVRVLQEGEAKGLSERMIAYIQQEVGEPKPGHIRLMAPLTYDESVRLYNAVLDEFPGALGSISIVAGREAVAAAANDFLTKIDRVKKA
ncbi:MAG: hypothetical protein JWP58_3256 [Hymenobacter sp.]|nr:hypothetical protein [Hymenobacter sp.]